MTGQVSRAAIQGPDVQFLYHMFLDELGDFGGNTIDSATESFRFCLERANLDLVPSDILESGQYTLSAEAIQAIKANQEGKDGIEKIAMGLLHYQAKVPFKENEKDAGKEMRVIIQMGYYEENTKKGHACSVLIFKKSGENDAIVAIADTGETALRSPYFSKNDRSTKVSSQRNTFEGAVVLVACTTYDVARRVASFAETVRTMPTSREDLSKARTHIWLACIGRTGDILPEPDGKYPLYHEETKAMHKYTIDLTWEGAIDENTASSVDTDRSSAVSSLTLGKINTVWNSTDRKDRLVASHMQRGSTCTFSSTLWLLGIACALEKHGSILLTDRSNDAAKMKSASDDLLKSVNEVDRRLKMVAFEYIYSMVGTPNFIPNDKYNNLTRLIAIEYAKCPWFNTRALRQKMYDSTKRTNAKTPDPGAVITEYTLVTSTRPRDGLSNVSTIGDGAGLATWIKGKGAYPKEDSSAKKAVHVLAFITAARGFIGSVVPDVFQHPIECSCADLLTIMKYAVHIMWMGSSQGKYVQQTLIGILMRVTRYAIALSEKDTKEFPIADINDESDYTLLRPTFSTTIPWVASEYLSLQRESEKIKRFLLHPSNIDVLGTLLSKQGPERSRSSTATIESSTRYTTPLINKNDASMTETQANLDKGAAVVYNSISVKPERLQEIEKEWREQITEKQSQNRTMREVNLTTDGQLKALQFINTQESLVLLNIVTWFTKAAIASVDTDSVNPVWTPGDETQSTYVFGLGQYFSVLLPLETKPSPGGVSEHIEYYRRGSRSMLEKVTDHPDIGRSIAFINNVDYLYNRTRDCTRPAATDGDDGTTKDRDLEITVKYTGKDIADTASHDVEALVALEDKTECTYENRGVVYALKRALMPMRRTGPSGRDTAQAKEILERGIISNEKEKESKPATITQDDIDIMKAMLMLYTDMGTHELTDHCKNHVFAGGRTDLIYHYVTLAILLGKVDGISAAISGEAESASATDPATRWAVTNIALGNGKTGTGPQYTYSQGVCSTTGERIRIRIR